MVTSLLNNDSSQKFIDAQDGAMETALHIASRCGHKTVIKLLISKRANKRIKNKVQLYIVFYQLLHKCTVCLV